MAAWEELVIACELKASVSQEVLDLLNYICNPTEEAAKSLVIPQHPFFQMTRWERVAQTDTYYFPGDIFSLMSWDEISQSYSFTARMMVRWGREILRAFVEWLWTYSKTRGFVGYSRNDETYLITLIEFGEDRIYYKDVELNPDLL
jgi:hypothetical protein